MPPSVAIVGRPNVGKSSLLNAVAGRRISIVEPTAGVTRDRISTDVEWGGRRFELVDTGGLGLVDEVGLKNHIERQIEAAMHEAALVVFVVDAKSGLLPLDADVAQRVRRLGKPVVLVANKVEARRDEFEAAAAARLGFGEPLLVSAKEGTGVSDLLDRIVELLPDEAPGPSEPALKIAVVGKRNSGKSTLVNLLCGQERVIVSEVPGTTRDAVDVSFERGGRRYVAIDTAGLRKRTRVQDAIEFFSLARSERAVRRADVVLLMFDLSQSVSQVDKKLAGFVVRNFKPCVLAANKLDLAGGGLADPARWEAYLRQELPGLFYAPVSFLSAKEGIHVDETLALLGELYEQAGRRVTTPELNRVLQAARRAHAPRHSGKQPKLFYATQVDVHPPTILVFVNEPGLFTGNYDRYLQNRLREHFGWGEIPIRLVYRRRTKVQLPPE